MTAKKRLMLTFACQYHGDSVYANTPNGFALDFLCAYVRLFAAFFFILKSYFTYCFYACSRSSTVCVCVCFSSFLDSVVVSEAFRRFYIF